MAADIEDVQSAVGELLASLVERLGRLDLLENPAGRIANFADKFSHQLSHSQPPRAENWRRLLSKSADPQD